MTRGDSRTAMRIAKNSYTSKFNRENRFLIDEDDTPHKLAFLLTKPFRKGMIFNGEGTYSFVLQEVTATKYDNHELGIADYYKYFPRGDEEEVEESTDASDFVEKETGEDEGKKVWI